MSSPMDAIEQAAREIASMPGGQGIKAILRKHFGPSEPRIVDHDAGLFSVDRRVMARYASRESLNEDGKWCGPGSGQNTLFNSRKAAESALAKAKETP